MIYNTLDWRTPEVWIAADIMILIILIVFYSYDCYFYYEIHPYAPYTLIPAQAPKAGTQHRTESSTLYVV